MEALQPRGDEGQVKFSSERALLRSKRAPQLCPKMVDCYLKHLERKPVLPIERESTQVMNEALGYLSERISKDIKVVIESLCHIPGRS